MKTGIKISPDHRTVLLFIIYLFLINRGSNSKTWMEQQGLKWSPVFISAPFKPTIEISQWNSPGRARILPVLQIHTKKRHSDVSVWSVAMELQDNPPHGCLCKPVPPLNSEERKKERKRAGNHDLWSVTVMTYFSSRIKNHRFLPVGSAISENWHIHFCRCTVHL